MKDTDWRQTECFGIYWAENGGYPTKDPRKEVSVRFETIQDSDLLFKVLSTQNEYRN